MHLAISLSTDDAVIAAQRGGLAISASYPSRTWRFAGLELRPRAEKRPQRARSPNFKAR